MPAYLARIGVTVFAMLFAIALITEHQAAGRGIVAAPRPSDAVTTRAAFVTAAGVTPARPTAAANSGGVVLASWYGPGFYGNRTACGQVYTPDILGVAHLTLPCGTLLTLTHGGSAVTVTVIDRGPYITGRTIDLSNATKLALGCSDLCTLRMQVSP